MFVFAVTIAFKLFTKNWKPWCVSSCLATSNLSHFYGRYFPLCGLPPLLYLCDLHLMGVQLFLDLKVSPLCVFSLYQLTETWSQRPIQSVAVQTQTLIERTNERTNKQTNKKTKTLSPRHFSAWYKNLNICGRQSHPSDVIPMRLMSRQDGNVPSKIFLPYTIGIQRLQLARLMSEARSFLPVLPCIMLLEMNCIWFKYLDLHAHCYHSTTQTLLER